jgi:quercetin dioxygenase-like cupin family protein
MKTKYTFITDIAEQDVPSDGILSRTVHNDEQVKAVLFGFGPGQELSEHTASVPAIIHVLRGEAELGLGDDVIEAKAGSWVHMPAQLRHRVLAKTSVVMLLLMLKAGAPGGNTAAGQ